MELVVPENEDGEVLGGSGSPGPVGGSGYKSVPKKEKLFANRKSQDIEWNGVNFTVKKSSTQVLTNCWGSAKPGTVTAILGPSGAGMIYFVNLFPLR
jgi:ABC-type multidrug transport system fused ATPase/permease subunit